MDVQEILYAVEWFFIAYLAVYSTFLFASIVSGSLALYEMH